MPFKIDASVCVCAEPDQTERKCPAGDSFCLISALSLSLFSSLSPTDFWFLFFNNLTASFWPAVLLSVRVQKIRKTTYRYEARVG